MGVLKAAFSNSGTVRPRVIGGNRPPSFALPGHRNTFFASSAKAGAGLQLLRDVFRLGLGGVDRAFWSTLPLASGVGVLIRMWRTVTVSGMRNSS